jgi:hypothetical protein
LQLSGDFDFMPAAWRWFVERHGIPDYSNKLRRNGLDRGAGAV